MAGCGARKGDPFSRQTQAALLNLAVALRPSWVGVCVESGRALRCPFSAAVPPPPNGWSQSRSLSFLWLFGRGLFLCCYVCRLWQR